jgi:hypothetical protein
MKYLAVDLRALGLMRICIAIVILLDLGVRISDLEAFYANTGAVPLGLVFQHTWNNYFVSLHAMNGLWQFQLILFLFSFFFAAMLLIGYRTRLFTVLSWLMMLSLHNRNSLILQGGDDLLRMVLFWSIFLPWGAAYSCDALLSHERFPKKSILTVATVAYLLQICYIYTGSALLKGREWNSDYTAMYYVYALDQIAYPVTRYLFYYPELLKKMTMVAYYFELLVPLLFFVPVKHQWFRYAGVLSVVFFHVFNSVTLLIGMFPLIGIATVTGLLPSRAMDGAERITMRMRAHVRDSFLQYAEWLRRLIPWREPVYAIPVPLDRAKTACLVFLVVFVFDWNFSNLSFVGSKLSDHLRVLGYTLRLDQNWGMFAPGVFKDDGWFVLEGTTVDGEHINLLEPGKPLSFTKPEAITSMFRNDRWRKYTENLVLSYNSFMRGYFTNYTMRVWNEQHPDKQLAKLELIYMYEFTQPDYQYVQPKKELLWVCENGELSKE